MGSSTSSKPPSSDGLRKKPVSLGEPSGRPSGGQTGHKGETLRQIATPDRIVTHEALACRHCGAGLTLSMAAGVERRQLFDLPERLLEVAEHQGLVYACPGCGGRTRATFPEGVKGPAQYGERVRAAAISLNAQQLIPEDRTAEALGDLFGAPGLCGASVAEGMRARAEALAPAVERIAALVRVGRVRRLDDPSTMLRTACGSGAKPNGCIPSPPRPSPSIGSAASAAKCPKGSKAASSSMTDSSPVAIWTARAFLPPMRSATLSPLRELKALITFDNEPCATPATRSGKPAPEAKRRSRPPRSRPFHARYREALRQGLAWRRSLPRLEKAGPACGRTKRRAGDNLLLRLPRFKDDVLRFLADFEVPFPNNLGPNRRCA